MLLKRFHIAALQHDFAFLLNYLDAETQAEGRPYHIFSLGLFHFQKHNQGGT